MPKGKGIANLVQLGAGMAHHTTSASR